MLLSFSLWLIFFSFVQNGNAQDFPRIRYTIIVRNDAREISTGRNVLGSLDDPLFQTMRENLSGYRFSVPDGIYEIELRFVEPKFKGNGQRVFDVEINGQTFLKNFDLVRESVFMQALIKKFRVSAENNSGVRSGFQALKDKPILSGVKVKKIL